jgi:AraC family transcriptional regulator of adaptative response/methylated-DNA-[protein]-cysteine methyltransferase
MTHAALLSAPPGDAASFDASGTVTPADYDRVERAIRYLETRFREQPSLTELAHECGVSEFHFQRMFTRLVGISPKRFLQYQTIAHARGLLARSRSVLDATYETGLSSAGRLHDLFVAVDAVTPGEFKRRGDGLAIDYGFHVTPFGEALVAVTSRGICGLWFVREQREGALAELARTWPEATLREREEATAPVAASVFSRDYPSGGRLGLLLRGTNFQIKVWEALLRIPEGAVVTYEDIAAAIGRPRAVRAVGNAVGSNPVSYLVPCHRVIRKTGEFGNYGGGRERKRLMLGVEIARVAAGGED